MVYDLQKMAIINSSRYVRIEFTADNNKNSVIDIYEDVSYLSKMQVRTIISHTE